MADYLERTRILIGDEAINRLNRQNIYLAGLGGVGAYIAEALARAGVGRLTIHDADIVTYSNINRQLIALHSTVGRKKTDVMKERIADINPNCIVKSQNIFITKETMPEVLQEDYDIVIDAIDVFNCKLAFLRYAFSGGYKIYSSMGAGNRIDPEKIRTGDFYESKHCRLAKVLRKKLKKSGIGKGITAVWSEEIGHAPGPEEERGDRSRPINGSISTIPALFGMTLAGLVIRDIIGDNV